MARGDHIKVRRYGYSHHGIDLGDGSVVHFAGREREKQDACVQRTPLSVFAKGGRVRTVAYRRRDPADAVCARALSSLGRVDYDLIHSNCEHFARWCMTGKRRSHQVRRALYTAAGLGIFTGVVAAKGILTVYSWRRFGRG